MKYVKSNLLRLYNNYTTERRREMRFIMNYLEHLNYLINKLEEELEELDPIEDAEEYSEIEQEIDELCSDYDCYIYGKN